VSGLRGGEGSSQPPNTYEVVLGALESNVIVAMEYSESHYVTHLQPEE
jgi:hypothetical protein